MSWTSSFHSLSFSEMKVFIIWTQWGSWTKTTSTPPSFMTFSAKDEKLMFSPTTTLKGGDQTDCGAIEEDTFWSCRGEWLQYTWCREREWRPVSVCASQIVSQHSWSQDQPVTTLTLLHSYFMATISAWAVGSPVWTLKLWPLDTISPASLTRTDPIGRPPSDKPNSASLTASCRITGEYCSLVDRIETPCLRCFRSYLD